MDRRAANVPVGAVRCVRWHGLRVRVLVDCAARARGYGLIAATRNAKGPTSGLLIGPFDEFTENFGRGERIRTSDPSVPNRPASAEVSTDFRVSASGVSAQGSYSKAPTTCLRRPSTLPPSALQSSQPSTTRTTSSVTHRSSVGNPSLRVRASPSRPCSPASPKVRRRRRFSPTSLPSLRTTCERPSRLLLRPPKRIYRWPKRRSNDEDQTRREPP